jgi:hypothetical protein
LSTVRISIRATRSITVRQFYYAFVLAYNKEALAETCRRLRADFFDIEKFPGKRSVIGWPSTGIVEMALLADGVAPEDLYPLDIDRAFAKLATIRDHIVFWNSGAESQQLLASGEAPICFCWDTRVSVIMREEGGENIGMSWNQAIATADMLVIPKGSPNKDLAMQFIANATTAENRPFAEQRCCRRSRAAVNNSMPRRWMHRLRYPTVDRDRPQLLGQMPRRSPKPGTGKLNSCFRTIRDGGPGAPFLMRSRCRPGRGTLSPRDEGMGRGMTIGAMVERLCTRCWAGCARSCGHAGSCLPFRCLRSAARSFPAASPTPSRARQLRGW